MKLQDTTYNPLKAIILLVLLCFSLCISSLHAQESCYEQYIRWRISIPTPLPISIAWARSWRYKMLLILANVKA